MKQRPYISAPLLLCAVLFAPALMGQDTPPPPTSQSTPEVDGRKGTVLFERNENATPVTGEKPKPASEKPTGPELTGPGLTGPEFTDAERSALTFTSYDLDLRLKPAGALVEAHARLALRNDSSGPLTRLALQISSTLTWERVALVGASGNSQLQFAQHVLETDADHTGKANEAVATLPFPLQPGKTLELDTVYGGTLPESTGRLERLGANHEQALNADWDGIGAELTAIRGFGNVLWYPVASPQYFLGEGAQLFDAMGSTEQRESSATIRLRIGVEYTGTPPRSAYFCGRRQPLAAVSDDSISGTVVGEGIATAEWPARELGFRFPNLVILSAPEQVLASPTGQVSPPVPRDPAFSSSSSNPASSWSSPTAETPRLSPSREGTPLLEVETANTASLEALSASAERIAPMLREWLGEKPDSALTVVDHRGQPFEDGPLLLAPIDTLAALSESAALAHSLTHAWMKTGAPWMDEGLAQFFALLATERDHGREAALAQLSDLMGPVSLSEPALEPGKDGPTGQPLMTATSEVYFRRKAAAVWWMLRGITGDQSLQLALHAWRLRQPMQGPAEQTAREFEALLEKTSGKDLHWFFDDWVIHDRGLPDLSLVDVSPRELPGNGPNHGWQVAVTVRNDGAAAAELPVVVRAGTLSASTRLRVAGFSSATTRVLVEALPTEVTVNGGEVPEQRTGMHTRRMVQKPQ